MESVPLPREPANYNEASSVLFSDSLKDLKNLRQQLYSAAEYFEVSFKNEDQKHVVVNTLKDYVVKALVNTVDHLGSVTYKVDDLLDEKIDEVSQSELRLSCVEQRLRSCGDYIGRQGISQQSLVLTTPKYHKRYILPVGETVHSATRTKSRYQGCNLDDEDDWHQFKNAIRATIKDTPPSVVSKGRSPSPSPKLAHQPGNFSFSGGMLKKDLAKRAASPHRFPLLRTGSLASKPTTPKSSRPNTPSRSRPTTPNPSHGRQQYPSELRRSASTLIRSGKEYSKDTERHPTKSKRLLTSLLSRRKSKKDDTLYTYLDEY